MGKYEIHRKASTKRGDQTPWQLCVIVMETRGLIIQWSPDADVDDDEHDADARACIIFAPPTSKISPNV